MASTGPDNLHFFTQPDPLHSSPVSNRNLSSPIYLQLYAGTKMRPGRTTIATPAATTTPLLLLLPLILGALNGAQAQCPWQRDVPDLQTSCICAYNLGRELSVQCDQVRMWAIRL